MRPRSPASLPRAVVIPIIMAALSPPGGVSAQVTPPPTTAAVFAAAPVTPGNLLIAIPNLCPIDVWLVDVKLVKVPAFLSRARVTSFSPRVLGGQTGTISVDFDTPATWSGPTTDDFVISAALGSADGTLSVTKSIPITFKTPGTIDECVAAVQYEPGHTRVMGDAPVTAVPDSPAGELPSAVRLGDAFPNPLRGGRLVIPFALPHPARVALRVYDVAGRLVRIVGEENVTAGESTFQWDSRGDDGVHVPSGIYYYTLTVDGRTYRKSVAVVK